MRPIRATRKPGNEGAHVSPVARIIRQFQEGREAVTLARLVALPHMPTMGTRLDLRAHGVEAPLEVVAVISEPTLTVRASSRPTQTSSPAPSPSATPRSPARGAGGTPSRARAPCQGPPQRLQPLRARTFAGARVLPVPREGRAQGAATRLLEQVPGEADPAAPGRTGPRGARAARPSAGEAWAVSRHHADANLTTYRYRDHMSPPKIGTVLKRLREEKGFSQLGFGETGQGLPGLHL